MSVPTVLVAAWALLIPAVISLPQPAVLPTLLPTGPAPITDPRFQNWQKPGPNDVRSPCPGLNTLANHGFINRNGRNMTIPHLITGLAAGMNIGPDFSAAVGGVGLLSSPNPFGGSFDLNDLDQHNFPIEHDASLSRQDAFTGNDYSFSQPAWNQVLASFGGSPTTTIATAAKARSARFQDSKSRNPTFVFGPRQFILAYGETALYLQTMGDTTSGVTRVDYIRSMFEQEKLPVALGWRPSAQQVTLTTLGAQIFQLFAANPQAAPEGTRIVADSYKDIWSAIAGGSNILSNLTSGITQELGL